MALPKPKVPGLFKGLGVTLNELKGRVILLELFSTT